MSADYKSVLRWITSLSRLQKDNKGISLTYLARQSSYPVQELDYIVRLLEQEGYIATKHPAPKITLIKPTISGYEKAQEWDKQALAKTPKGKFLTFGKVIGASLLAVLLGILWWWLGISPESSGLLPFRETIPIRLYQKDISPPNYYVSGGWYDFQHAPQTGIIVSANDGKEAEKVLSQLVPEYVPVTLNGRVSITFDVENITSSYQVNIDAVQIGITRKPVHTPENLFFTPVQLGGAPVREFELTLSPKTIISTGNDTELYQAKLKSSDAEVDYIYVRPGERETFEVSIQLDRPGSFELTPVIKYSFHDKQSTLQATSNIVIYPQEYRVWFWDSDYTSCEGGVCTGGGGTLLANPIILDTQSDNLRIEKQTKNSEVPACFPEKKWIAFESSMVTFGYLDRLFLINTDGEQLKAVSTDDLYHSPRKLAWLSNNQLLTGNPRWDDSLRNYVYSYFVLNPASLEKQEITSVDEKNIVKSNNLEKPQPCFSDGSACLVNKADSDTNGNGQVDHQDLQHLYLTQGDTSKSLAYISDQEQIEPVISPDNNWIAFVQRKALKSSCGNTTIIESIAVVKSDGSEQRQVTLFDGWYDNLQWSPDGQYLLYVKTRAKGQVEELSCGQATHYVYAINLESGVERQLTYYESEDPYFEWSWSSDGKWVFIGWNRLTIASIDGTCSQDIFIPPYGYVHNILPQP